MSAVNRFDGIKNKQFSPFMDTMVIFMDFSAFLWYVCTYALCSMHCTYKPCIFHTTIVDNCDFLRSSFVGKTNKRRKLKKEKHNGTFVMWHQDFSLLLQQNIKKEKRIKYDHFW